MAFTESRTWSNKEFADMLRKRWDESKMISKEGRRVILSNQELYFLMKCLDILPNEKP